MARRIRVLMATAVLLVAALASATTALAGDPCYHGYTIPAPTTAETSSVKLDPCAFLPTNAQVATGSTVTFTNTSEFPHLLMGANAAWGDRDKEIPVGESVSVRFDKPGIYAYACALHRGMSGAIIVGDPGGGAAAAATGSASDGLGLATGLAIAALAALAAAGWALAFFQRRSPRFSTATAERAS